MLASLALLATVIDPAALPRAGRVDPRFQSYNIEMVEVTGGRFWKPYRLGPPTSPADRYAYRPPLDLANRRLVMLAKALGPAYVRVSGTWANTTWFADAENAPKAAPPGYDAMLTRAQWRGVAKFLAATDGPLVTSFAGSAGARDAKGLWQPDQMRALVAYSATLGIRIAGAEFLNEPNLIAATGAPAGYTAADYGRDHDRFAVAFRKAVPGALVLGAGSVGDGGALESLASAAKLKLLPSRDLMAAMRVPVDVLSYHHYGAVSQRCATSGPISVTPEQALDPAWLARTDTALQTYLTLRDRHAPRAPVWLTETAQAACGGSPWAATFRDTPRYVDQLGRLARQGVQVVMHNTLAASDYGLLDETDFAPRPNYWAALIWARTMGPTVLKTDVSTPTLHVYAHCLKGAAGGVALVAVNLSDVATAVEFVGHGSAYALAGRDGHKAVALNGAPLALTASDALPPFAGTPVSASAPVAPGGVTFVAVPSAKAAACR